MNNFGEAFQKFLDRNITKTKPSMLRLIGFAVPVTILDYFKPYDNLGLFIFVVIVPALILFSLLIFEAGRFGLLAFNKYGGWISFAFLIAVMFSGRTLNGLVSTKFLTSAVVFIAAGFMIGALFGLLKKHEKE